MFLESKQNLGRKCMFLQNEKWKMFLENGNIYKNLK